MESLLELFVHVDDFCQTFLPNLEHHLLSSGAIQRRRARSLSMSEVMTILIRFHQSHYRDFKAYYCEHVLQHLHPEFPGLVSYTRFVDYIPSALFPLCFNATMATAVDKALDDNMPSQKPSLLRWLRSRAAIFLKCICRSLFILCS